MKRSFIAKCISFVLKAFHLSFFQVMDEADRILSKDFEDELDCIIRCLSKKRRTMLFSATITNKVSPLADGGVEFDVIYLVFTSVEAR